LGFEFDQLILYLRTLPGSVPLSQTSPTSIFNKPSTMTTASLLVLILILCAISHTIPALSTTPAYPSVPGTETTDCSLSGTDELRPVRREVYGGGRIFDISHRYVPDMPVGLSSEGLGQFLWLPKSIKNGSLANNSEMKLPAHTGTHVDAPGHVFDHYFDAGFDVDTLDLEVLNGNCQQLIVLWLFGCCLCSGVPLFNPFPSVWAFWGCLFDEVNDILVHHVCQAQQEMGFFFGYYYLNHNGFFLKVNFFF
jgi:hypothetical protein